jgi:hypothetical protein
MKFILSESTKEKQLTLADVEVNQFFVNQYDWLCQKVCSNAYIKITDREGKPYADFYDGEDDEQPIQRILPNVERIEY